MGYTFYRGKGSYSSSSSKARPLSTSLKQILEMVEEIEIIKQDIKDKQQELSRAEIKLGNELKKLDPAVKERIKEILRNDLKLLEDERE